MAVKLGLPPVQPKEDLDLLKKEFGGRYVDQLMTVLIQLGEEDITRNNKAN